MSVEKNCHPSPVPFPLFRSPRWAPKMNVITYRGNKIERRDLHSRVREGDFNVVVTTYEMILKDRAVLSKVWRE